MAEGKNPGNEIKGDIKDQKTGRRQNLESMPIQELRRRAENRGIRNTENLNKQEIIELLHKKGE